MTLWTRRHVLGAAVATGGVVLLPFRAGIAQDRAAALLRAPKQALVIGNSSYKGAPLKNPSNDARGMAEALKAIGFEVSLGFDLGQDAMSELIKIYVGRLANSKAVGLFYFAGHGTQVAWRNYMVPVNAEIASIESIKESCIDINTLIAGIRMAGNPMNVIILDACRDNPFGRQVQPDQKGLSQLDAPPGTLLAYATAPGNTAIDGEGENGLYTGHLLREIKVPEAKIEDVFKRVRLGVRRASNGLQIPWESTSLEEDFWFIPPRELKKLAEADIEREYKAESALWEQIRNAESAEPFVDYLAHYPSGRFAELAQLQLDRVLAKLGEKKIESVSAPQNPYSKGTARTDTAYRVGDFYSFVTFDPLTKIERPLFTVRVTAITDHEVIANDGSYVNDLLGNRLKRISGESWSANQTVPTEFIVGKRWNSRFRVTNAKGVESSADLDLRIADRESITVPAGTFNAFRVEAIGWHRGRNVNNAWNWKAWYEPDRVRRPVRTEWLIKDAFGRIVSTYGDALATFKQG